MSNIISKETANETVVVFKMVAARRLANGDMVLKSMYTESTDSWENFLKSTFSDDEIDQDDHVIEESLYQKLEETARDADDYEELCSILDGYDWNDETAIINMVIEIATHTTFTIEEICSKLTDFSREEVEAMTQMAEPEVFFKDNI